MPVLILGLILALAGGGGVVYASHDATPGSALYAVKSMVKQVEEQAQISHKSAALQSTDERGDDLDAGQAKHGKPGKLEETITSTVSLSSTVPITGTNWYSHTVSAIGSVTGTVGITLTKTLSDVVSIAEDQTGHGKSYQGLAAKLRALANSLDRENANAGLHQLNAFMNQAEAMYQSGRIGKEEFDALQADSDELIRALEATPSVKPAAKAINASKKDAAEDPSSESATLAEETNENKAGRATRPEKETIKPSQERGRH